MRASTSWGQIKNWWVHLKCNIITQIYIFACVSYSHAYCFAAGLQDQSRSKWFRGRGIYSASACGCVAHQPDSASSLLPHQQNRELPQPTRKDLHQHCEVWSLFRYGYQKHPQCQVTLPLLSLLFLEMLFWRCPFLESFAFTGWILFPNKSQ